MLAVKRVEFRIVRGAVLRAEPPAPVAAFRREQRLISFFQAGVRRGIVAILLARFGVVRIGAPRVPEQLPGGNIFVVPTPDVEIGVDPRSGENSGGGGDFLGGGDGFAGG